MTRLLAVQPCNAAGKLQAVYLSRRKQNHAQFARPCLGLLDDPLTTQPCRKGALFHMQSMQPAPWKARLFVMPSSEKEPRKLVLRGLVCPAVNPSRAAQHRYTQAYSARRQPSADRNHAAGLFRMQSRRRRWRGLQPYNAARPSMARRNHAATGTCSPVHAAQAGYANSPRIALYRPCGTALYPPRTTHCKSCQRPFQTV